jgi:hypothetical protein
MRKYLIAPFFVGIYFLQSCKSTVLLHVPDAFVKESTLMKVKGSKSSGINHKISFGNYTSTGIKRGWVFPKEKFINQFGFEKRLLSIFGIEKNEVIATQKEKFHYSLLSGANELKVYCNRKIVTEETRYEEPAWKRIQKQRTDFERTFVKSEDYTFTAVLFTVDTNIVKPWKLILSSYIDEPGIKLSSDGIKVTVAKETGYITNYTDTITIRQIFTSKSADKNNITNGFLFRLHTGYEFRIGNGVVAIVDIISHSIWLYNDLTADEKLRLSAAASAILINRSFTKK